MNRRAGKIGSIEPITFRRFRQSKIDLRKTSNPENAKTIIRVWLGAAIDADLESRLHVDGP
tara:strand:+ start:216 stop:398 length:183 start_codon:yes stop_codon:yes gene_type:complete